MAAAAATNHTAGNRSNSLPGTNSYNTCVARKAWTRASAITSFPALAEGEDRNLKVESLTGREINHPSSWLTGVCLSSGYPYSF